MEKTSQEFKVGLIVKQEQELKELTPIELLKLATSIVEKEKNNTNTKYICMASVVSIISNEQ